MYIPIWAAIATGVATLAGSIFASLILLKNNNKSVQAQITTMLAELSVTEEANLRDDQRELINTLKTNTASFQELITKYAEAIINEARTQTKLASLEAEVQKLRDDFLAVQKDRDKLLEKAACVPLLEEQNKDHTRTIRQQAQTIKQQSLTIADLTEKLETATVLSSAAARAQERAEGAKIQADRVIEQISSQLTTPNLSPPTLSSPNLSPPTSSP